MRWYRLPLLLLIVLSTARCSTLFNQQRSDTATNAQKKFSDVRLADLLREERTHNAETLTREIGIAQRQLTAARDAKLIAMLSSKRGLPAELTDAIADRMKLLQGTDDGIAALLLTIEEQENALAVDTATYLVVRTRSDPKADCAKSTAAVSQGAKDYYEMVEADCEELALSRQALAARTNAGLLGSTAQEIAATEQARIETAALVKEAEENTIRAVDAVTVAQKKSRAGVVLDAEALARLKTKLGQLMLPGSNDLGGIGLNDVRLAAALRWAEVQKAAVETTLEVATSGGPPPEDFPKQLQIAAMVPSLAEQLRSGFRYPRVSALVMEAQRLRLEGERYQRRLARADEELELQRTKLRRLRLEWDLLSEATVHLRDNHLEIALQKYTESWTGGRIPLTAIEWKLIGLTHERALDASESAIAQWDGLVRTPLEALVASAGSGLRPAEIARLLQTLEMSALAAGVF
jgi:hypothetical protein